MANPEHLKILKQGVDAWNTWRRRHPEIKPDLERAPLSGLDLSHANLMRANLRESHLTSTNLSKALLIGAKLNVANLSKAALNDANLCGADLHMASLTDADLTGAHISWTHLTRVNLERAKLNGADLTGSSLVEANVADAIFTDCRVYGISAWNLTGEPREQFNLLISRTEFPHNEPVITVDNLEVAQFIYMLLNYKKLREVLKTVTSKIVLILGRFTPERKKVLDALADALRSCRNERGEAPYLPIMFDFNPDTGRDLLETAEVLAGMSRFIIADITAPRAVFTELQSIIPRWKVPVELILDTSTDEEPALLLTQFADYPWLVRADPGSPVLGYESTEELCASVEQLVAPLERMFTELEKSKAKKTLGVKPLTSDENS
ncbi:MAG: pentapeptide repeat-containing protein [Halobacteriota archaeon]